MTTRARAEVAIEAATMRGMERNIEKRVDCGASGRERSWEEEVEVGVGDIVSVWMEVIPMPPMPVETAAATMLGTMRVAAAVAA